MTSASAQSRYSTATQIFHWLTVIFVAAAYLLGEGGPESRIYSDERAVQLSLHETFGMAVLVVLVLRLGWRFFEHAPEVPMASWMRLGSRLIHLALYVLLAAVPLTAILGAWSEGHSLQLLGLGGIGPLMPLNHELGETLAEIHETLGNLIVVIAGIHAAAALFHHFILRDRVLVTMLPFGNTRS